MAMDGLPDLGILSLPELEWIVSRISENCSLPNIFTILLHYFYVILLIFVDITKVPCYNHAINHDKIG